MRHFSLPFFCTFDGTLATGAWELHKPHTGTSGVAIAQNQPPPWGTDCSVERGIWGSCQTASSWFLG